MTENTNDLREMAKEEIESLPAETAAGNVDPDSEGPDAATYPSDKS